METTAGLPGAKGPPMTDAEPKDDAANGGTEAEATSRRAPWRLIALAVVAVGLTVAFIVYRDRVREVLETVLEWTRGLGAWGPPVVAAAYAAATVLFVPGSALTLGAGFLFGVLVGTIVVSVGSVLGACGAFLVGRTVARGWVARKVAGNPKFAAIDEAVGRQGFRIVLLTRLSPIFPFNMLNYAYGLTKVPFWKYALASWIGMLPGTVMYVYLGSGLRSLAAAAAGETEGGMAERIFFWVGLAVAILVALVVTRIARRALKRATDERLAADEESA
jgi:uncharacterized membrane protein YdjX (TVP38/TMEM64 family)